jgi:Hemerythrin HHE cation binding domain
VIAPPAIGELLSRDHRRLDELFGRFLGAAAAGEQAAAAEAIGAFDAALRRHTALEEEHLFPRSPGKLVPLADETGRDRVFRELRLEHVQLRELSGMIARLAAEESDPGRARGLAANLARRWDAHTAREEQEAFLLLEGVVDPAGEAAIRDALA